MWRTLGLLCVAALLVLGIAPSARAGTVYIYTGTDFTSFTNPGQLPAGVVGLGGSVTLSTALGDNFSGFVTPAAFSFTDGATTITQANESLPYDSFYFVTNSSGAIVSWDVELCAAGPSCEIPVDYVESINTSGGTDDYSLYINSGGTYGMAWNVSSPGAWVVTPEPSALLMLGSGLIGLVGVSRRKIRS
jgi:hypothetical protein